MVKKKPCHEVEIHHPSYLNQKRRLNRVKGQIEGIDKMIADNRYCIDIIIQIRAAKAALGAIEKEIMQTHLKSCVKTAIESTDKNQSNIKIEEILKYF